MQTNLNPAGISPQTRTRGTLLALLLFLIYTISSFGIYTARSLQGDTANHILAGEMFGTPEQLRARGVRPLYYGSGQTGWDGQFYYYMSNDVLGVKDTAAHIDAPSYRYQRIGLSLYAAAMSALLMRDWVSPNFYLGCYLLLIAAATLAGARLLARFGAHPGLILFWSLSVGTQITLFNALPDAAADAFLILALAALFSGRPALAVVPFALAGLSREVYVLFPSLILLWHLIDTMRAPPATAGDGPWLVRGVRSLLVWRAWYLLFLPGLVVVLWQVYVIQHFGTLPSSQANVILGMPFGAWSKYLLSGLSGKHILVGASDDATREAVSLILFMLVLAGGLWLATRTLIRRPANWETPELRGVASALLSFVLLYLCFGNAVMMHYTGYVKAIAVFFFGIPLLLAAGRAERSTHGVVYALLALALLYTSWYNMQARILPYANPADDRYTNFSKAQEGAPIACLTRFDVQIKVREINIDPGQPFGHLFGWRGKYVITMDLTNTSDQPFVSRRGSGGVFMSYHWVDDGGRVVVDGTRSALTKPLLPGETAPISVVAPAPIKGSRMTLRLSPVQEGCAWFYLVNPQLAELPTLTLGQ